MRHLLLAGSLTLVFASAGTTASAEPTEEEKESARTLLDEGDARFGAGDLPGALRAYEAADLVMNVPTTAIEVAKTRARLGKLLGARDAARRVLAFPTRANEPDAFVAARREAEALLLDLEKRVARVTLVPRPPSDDVAIEVDGVARPFAATIDFEPGAHRIVATSHGAKVTHALELREGGRVELPLVFAAGEAPPLELRPRFVASPVFWVGASVAVTGAALATAFGVASASITSDLEEACPGLAGCDPNLVDDYARANDFANVSNVSLAVMGAGVVTAVIGIVVAETSGDDPASVRGLTLRF